MSRRTTWPDRIEVGRVRPGLYLVEGFTVERVAGRGRWEVRTERTGKDPVIHGQRPTLLGCFDLVDELRP